MHSFDADRDTRRGLMNEAIALLANKRVSFTPPSNFQSSAKSKKPTLCLTKVLSAASWSCTPDPPLKQCV